MASNDRRVKKKIGFFGLKSLLRAAREGNVEKMKGLLSSSSTEDIDTPDKFGRTFLFIATASKDCVPIIELLVKSGSNAIDTPNNLGYTPLYLAAARGHDPVIEAFVRLGSKAIDTPDNYGWTPMHEAANCGCTSMIKTLVRLGSKAINTPDNCGRTAVYYAKSHGDVECKRTLVALNDKIVDGIDVNEDYRGEVRYSVYFSQSLVSRLLFSLECNQNFSSTKRIL